MNNDDLDETDKELWDIVSEDIKKIDKNVRSAKRIVAKKSVPRKENKKKTTWSEPMGHTQNLSKIDASNIDKSSEMDRKTLRGIKKKRISVEDVLDMHGMNQDEAYEALLEFIHRNFAMKKKFLLVITGKGGKKQGKIGILKSKTPMWLSSEPLVSMVRKYNDALPKDGGSGALYVFL